MRVLILTLSSDFLDDPLVFPYLGALTLVQVAKNVGASFVYDASFKPGDEVKYSDVDVVAISATTPQAVEAYQVKDIFKALGKKVIIGGSHATYYSDICEEHGFDAIVVGDGEKAFYKLLKGEIPFDGQVIRENIEMTDYVIPYRDKALLNEYKYYLNGELATTLMSSRGCPNQCAFCESSSTKCKKVSEKVFYEEVKFLVKDCGYRALMIFDDVFTLSVKGLERYLEVLRIFHNQYGVIFRCFTHANIIARYPVMIEMLKEAGCVEVGVGMESASDRMLRIVNKKTTSAELNGLVLGMAKAGIRIKAFFMIGLPGESVRDLEETEKFIRFYRGLYPDLFDFDLTVFFPYRGTAIGNSLRSGSKEYGIRLKEGLTWGEVDRSTYGAYKKKLGASDIVIETYEWARNEVLMSANKIALLKEHIYMYSSRMQNLKVGVGR